MRYKDLDPEQRTRLKIARVAYRDAQRAVRIAEEQLAVATARLMKVATELGVIP